MGYGINFCNLSSTICRKLSRKENWLGFVVIVARKGNNAAKIK